MENTHICQKEVLKAFTKKAFKTAKILTFKRQTEDAKVAVNQITSNFDNWTMVKVAKKIATKTAVDRFGTSQLVLCYAK